MNIKQHSHQRIQSLDFLRGLAILGILLINIESFSYPEPWSPFAYGFETDKDHLVRFIVYWLAQGKFYFMLSLLFGVGFTLFLDNAKKKYEYHAYQLYFKRLLWLFIIGLIHAYLIWDGDILFHYATCGVLLLLFEPLNSKAMIAVILIMIAVLMFNNYQKTSDRIESFDNYLHIKEKTFEQRSAAEQRRFNYWQNQLKKRSANTDDIETVRMTYWQSILANYDKVEAHKGVIYHKSILFRTVIMMLVGVLLFKSGIFSNYGIFKYYWLLTLSFLLMALTVNYFRYYHWTYTYQLPIINIWKSWLFLFPRELLALSYILVFNGLYQKFGGGRISQLIANVGRLALSNYILQSILCGFIFYGYGLGFYNQLTRVELLPIVSLIVFGQIVLSWLWLSKYPMGPIEYLWRKMIYHRQ